ncbi:hypothetical protein WJ85_34945 [Burkholderia ubonensis]|uniref:hypothetical protein n=1 Tax=Burkholderia ubonensis TaxID=101571 RepID=UPI00075C027F|nr:hypothetical protein [Burkholderia ubonensis]KVP26040.1 hypothetical protein WJ85_34945 [Burkholderia ubonensis]KWC07117.1 hypothetical protein WL44_21350 [Burkholderia ubonensis]
MNDDASAGLKRRIWSFNVEVARYAHPAWLAEWRRTVPARFARDRRMQSQHLIAAHVLGLVEPAVMQSPVERVALLSARDTHQLVRCWMARLCVKYLRVNVAGRVARMNTRVLGEDVINQVLAAELLDRQDGLGFPVIKGIRINRPIDLTILHRRTLLTLSNHMSPEVAARFRLRFRPKYFDNLVPLRDLHRFEEGLAFRELDVHMSKEGVCILRSP